jgi:hypothetical protein
MVFSRLIRFFFLMIILVLIAGACASSRPGYHPKKAKRPKHCNCSDWSYDFNLKTYYLQKHEEGSPGGA